MRKRDVNILYLVIPFLEMYTKRSSKKTCKMIGWENAYLSYYYNNEKIKPTGSSFGGLSHYTDHTEGI